MIGYLAKVKARTVFSGMIYLTWCGCIVINMTTGKAIPDMLSNVVLMQMSFYFGAKAAKKFSKVE